MAKRKTQLAKAAALGIGAGGIEFMATSGWMHRSKTHNAWKLPKPLEMGARIVAWTSGVIPRKWAAVHRLHHEHADSEGDPHSPVLQGKMGVLKLIMKNSFLYHKVAHAMSDEELPEDLTPDELDSRVVLVEHHTTHLCKIHILRLGTQRV